MPRGTHWLCALFTLNLENELMDKKKDFPLVGDAETFENPAGVVDIDDAALTSVAGGCGTPTTFVASCVRPPVNCP